MFQTADHVDTVVTMMMLQDSGSSDVVHGIVA